MMPESRDANQSLFLRLFVGFATVVFVFLLSVLALLWVHQVPYSLTTQDKLALRHMLSGIDKTTPDAPYADQIMTIGRAQAAIFEAAPEYKPIPKGQIREPSQLVEAGHGYCFDRARSIDKALRFLGFKTRYAALYSIDQTGDIWASLMRKGGDDVISHAAVEVLTQRGWLVVDSVHPWLAINQTGDPLSFADMQDGYNPDQAGEDVYKIYRKAFRPVYGLYSRHGMAYPPFNIIPDFNWNEAWANFNP